MMKDIEELRGLAVIEGKDLATYEYELLKDLYEENQEQQRILNKIKEKVKYYRSAKYGTYDSDDILADLSYILLEEIE